MADDVYVSFGGDTGPLEAAAAIAKAQINGLAREMKALATEIRTTGATADSELAQKLNAVASQISAAKSHMNELNGELKAHKESASVAGEGIAFLREQLRSLAEAAGIAFSIEAVKEWISAVTEGAEKIERSAAKLGATTDEVQQIGAVARLTGTDFDTMSTQLERLQLGLARTALASSPVAAALHALGIDAAGFRRENIPAQIETLAGAFSRFADGPAKTAAAVALLGRAGADMIPYLDRGKAGLEELNAAAERTGVIMSTETVAAFAKTREDINALGLAWTGLSQNIYAAANGPVRGAVVMLTDLAVSLSKAASAGGDLYPVLHLVANGARLIESGVAFGVGGFKILNEIATNTLNTIAQEFASLGKETRDIFVDIGAGVAKFFEELPRLAIDAVKSIGRQFADLGAAISAGLHGDVAGARAALSQINSEGLNLPGVGDAIRAAFDFSNVGADIKANADNVREIWAQTGADIVSVGKQERNELDAIWGAAGTGGGLGPEGRGAGYPQLGKPQVPDLNIGGRGRGGAKGGKDTGTQDEIAAQQELIRVAEDGAKQQEKSLDDLLKHHQISVQQWLGDTTAVLEKEKASVKAAYDQEIAIATAAGKDATRIKDAEADALRKIDDQEVEAHRKAIDDMEKQYSQLGGTVLGAWNSQLKGLLAGTESWSVAMKKIAADLVIKMIEGFEKMAVEWAARQLAMTTVAVASQATQTSAAVAGAAAQKAVNTTAISADAGRAAAGAYAAVAGIPFVGPILAPAAAAVAFAGVEAFGSFDQGAYELPRTQMALVHQSELIMPAGPAKAFRSMLEGGAQGGGRAINVAPNIHFHNSSIDTRGGAQWIHDNSHSILKEISRAARHGAHLGLQRHTFG